MLQIFYFKEKLAIWLFIIYIALRLFHAELFLHIPIQECYPNIKGLYFNISIFEVRISVQRSLQLGRFPFLLLGQMFHYSRHRVVANIPSQYPLAVFFIWKELFRTKVCICRRTYLSFYALNIGELIVTMSSL